MKPAVLKFWILVIGICGIFAFLNSISFFTSLARTPSGTVYLGTIHYWEDYFYYLNHFFQGAHGAWLIANRYTSEMTNPSIIYWGNMMIGKIGGIFALQPILTYNIGVLLFSFTSLFISYIFLLRIFSTHPTLAFWAFISGSFATSLINRVHAREGGMTWWPFQIWKTPHFAFDRLGGTSHQQIQTILAYGFFIFLTIKPTSGKNRILALWGPVLTNIILTTINPIQSVFYTGILAGTYMVMYLFQHTVPNRYERIRLFILLGTTALIFAYTSGVYHELPHITSIIWEAKQHSYTTLPFLLLSIGPIVFFAFFGLLKRWKNITTIELFGILTIASGYVLFLSKIPQMVGFSNLRILFPASYVFWGIFAAYGIQFLSEKMKTRIRFLSLFSIQICIVFLYMAITLPTLSFELKQKLIQAKPDDPTVYLKSTVMDAFIFLSKTGTFNDVVLADPASHMDSMTPALSGHTVFSGHMLATINNDQKQKEARSFLTGEMTPENARQFLTNNNIRYILYTTYDGNKENFKLSYPFMKSVFENMDASIYTSQ